MVNIELLRPERGATKRLAIGLFEVGYGSARLMATKGYLNIFHTVGLGLNMGLSAATAGFELTTYERNATTLRIALTDQTL